MAVENAVMPECANHEPPNTITRLMRNIIMGSEFVMSHITHFYHLAALSYVQGPNMAPWTPYFDNSYYVGPLLRPQGTGSPASGAAASSNAVYAAIMSVAGGPANYLRDLPATAKQNVLYANGVGSAYTGLDGIWDNVVLDYVTALKYRRDAAAASARLGGRTPQIQNGCLVGGCASKPATAVIAEAQSLISGCATFIEEHQIPLTHVVSWLYGPYGGAATGGVAEPAIREYDNDGNPGHGYGSSEGSGLTGPGAQRVLAWGAFDTDDNGGDGANRLLPRGCYEWDGGTSTGCMDPVSSGNLVEDKLVEYITNSNYEDATGVANNWNGMPQDPYQTFDDGLHPFDGYTNPVEDAGYSWSKSPRIMDGTTAKACQVGPLARMAVKGEIDPGTQDYESYQIGATKAFAGTLHPYLGPIVTESTNLNLLVDIYGSPLGGFKCGFSTMDRHRARAYEALLIANAIDGWCDDLIAETGDSYTPWYNDVMSTGTKTGYGAHEAPRGALAHFVTIKGGKIASYQCVVPTTWNVNPKAPDDTMPGPIESAVMGITLSGQTSTGNIVPVEALRVVQGFDPCIACTVH